jgi:hypothetical protein
MMPWRTKGDLVISMTIAETFLLLVFMLWYVTRAQLTAKPPTQIEQLATENQRLKKDLADMHAKLADVERRLEWWRTRFDQPVPSSEEELKKILFEAGRGKPKCQDDNVLLDVRVINGATTFKVLADAPGLRTVLLPHHVDFQPGSILSTPDQIDGILQQVRAYRKGPGKDGDCRFDYHFTFSTVEDYYNGRERFEKYFYSAGRRRTNATADQ